MSCHYKMCKLIIMFFLHSGVGVYFGPFKTPLSHYVLFEPILQPGPLIQSPRSSLQGRRIGEDVLASSFRFRGDLCGELADSALGLADKFGRARAGLGWVCPIPITSIITGAIYHHPSHVANRLLESSISSTFGIKVWSRALNLSGPRTLLSCPQLVTTFYLIAGDVRYILDTAQHNHRDLVPEKQMQKIPTAK